MPVVKRFPTVGRALLVALVVVVAAAAGCGAGGGGDQAPSAGNGSTAEQTSAATHKEKAPATQQKQETRETTREKQTSAQPNKETVTVRVKGEEGTAFSGSLGGAEGVRRVEGSVPESYEVPFGSGSSRAGAVSASVRKEEQGGGALKVELVRDGEVVKSKESSGSSGFVNVVFAPRQGQQ